MNLSDIKRINQKIYELDTEITRNNKMMFISTLILCSLNKDFRNPNKLTNLINFVASTNPIDDLINLAKGELKKINILDKTRNSVETSLNIIHGVNTKLHKNRDELKNFVLNFVTNVLPLLQSDENLFLETMYMEIDKKAKNNDKGITLTPNFAAQLMVDLAQLDYKTDVVADLGSGTGLFSLLSYSTMLNSLEKDKSNLTADEYIAYKKRLLNSIIANDFEPKMVTLCLVNFIIKDLNTGLIHNEDIFEMGKHNFDYISEDGKRYNINPTKGILNPPYEDTFRPMEILRKTLELIKSDSTLDERVVVIIPPQKFGQKRDEFHKILNLATLKTVIKMQDDLFTDSGQTPSTSIFVFTLNRAHNKNDEIVYYDFSDSGYVYLKDSGMVDKSNTHHKKKNDLLEIVRNNKKLPAESLKRRDWGNFYEVNKVYGVSATIDPDLVKIDKEEADITIENITIKRILDEKRNLINECSNFYIDHDGAFERHIIDILSEDVE